MPPKRPVADAEGALYVKLPSDAVERLHRAAEALGIRKKDLVANLITRHVDPDSAHGLSALGAMAPRRVTIDAGAGTPTLGAYSFTPHDTQPPPEVLTVAQVAALLQVDDKLILELAKSGELPGRKLGSTWRFSRAAVIGWLGGAA